MHPADINNRLLPVKYRARVVKVAVVRGQQLAIFPVVSFSSSGSSEATILSKYVLS